MTGVFEKVGLGYSLTEDDAGVEMRVGRLRRSSGELSGELIVRTWIKGVRTYGKSGILHQARFNLSSSRARTDLGRTLEKRAPGIELDWFGLLEELAQSTLEAEGKGEEIVEVGTLKPDPTRLKYGIDPLCPFRATTWLYGPGGSGKSAFALAAALSVRMGREILPGMAPAMKGEVLYLDWETDQNTVNERVQTICRGLSADPVAIKYRRCNRPLADDAEQIAAIVARVGVKFVVVDSAAYAMGAQGEYGDANDSTIRLFEAVRLIGVTTLVVDHVSKAEMRLGGKVRAAMPYGCYSAETEVLTRRGWVRHDALVHMEEVLAFDPATEQLAWQVPSAYHQYRFKGDMARWSTKATHALVTPNHRMLIRPDWPSGRGQGWRFMEERDVPTADVRIVAAGRALPEHSPTTHLPEPLVRLLGWWIAEGSVQDRRLRLSQNAGPLADRIDATFAELGLHPWRQAQQRPHATHVHWVLPASDMADFWAAECGTSALTKRLPAWVFGLSLPLKCVLFEALMDGDGHRRPGYQSYHTSSPRLADDVQRLAILLGYHADVHRDVPLYKGQPRPTYRVSITGPTRRSATFRRDRAATTEPYDGFVYCLTVPSGAYVTRLDGRMSIQGNSAYKINGSRSAWELRRLPEMGDGMRIGLVDAKVNDRAYMDPIGIRAVWVDNSLTFLPEDVRADFELMPAGPASTSPELTVAERMIELLSGGGRMRAADIARTIDANSGTVRVQLNRDKRFTKTNIGEDDAWMLTP